MKKTLFICKKNETYGFTSYTRRSSGLYNSTRFIVESLVSKGVEADIQEAIDNNCIDGMVFRYKPDLVVIEALWVVPEKMKILMKLHPKVKWAVHMHSHMPFLALEGIAMEWIKQYRDLGITIIANSEESYHSLHVLVGNGLVYLPNVYISVPQEPKFKKDAYIDVGCFGAVRPLKNQLQQALAAIKFARKMGKKLRFHINSSRTETGGQQVLKNLVHLFENSKDGELINHAWYNPEEFHEALKTIDIGLQVSLTETFNVVTADYVTVGVPIVVSKEVKWASRFCKAQDDSVDSIVDRMYRVYQNKVLVKWNQKLLLKYSAKAQKMWYDFVK